MRIRGFAAAIVALMLAGGAYAQEAPPPPPPSGPTTGPTEFRGLDDRISDFNRLSSDLSRNVAGPTKSRTPIPISPEDVTMGSEVHDRKGLVLGTVDRVGTGFAVIASPAGKIEIEFQSLAKNYKGLMINMPKAKFDTMVSGKPAN